MAIFSLIGPLKSSLTSIDYRCAVGQTASLLDDRDLDEEPLGRPGDRRLLLGFDDGPVAIVELTEVRVLPAAEIDVRFARDEGEGFESVDDWREAHERFFERPIDGDTQIVAVRFKVVERL